MKEHILIIFVVLLTGVGFSQDNELNKAQEFYSSQTLDSAKKYVDLATYHYEFNDQAKTMFLRGEIYFDLGVSGKAAYRDLHPNALAVSARSFVELEEFDPQGKLKSESKARLEKIQHHLLNKGVQHFQMQEYAPALQCFETAIYSGEYTDKVNPKGYYFAGMCSEAQHSYDLAIYYFRKCIQHKYRLVEMYTNLLQICKDLKRDEQFLEFLEEGRDVLPKSRELMMEEIKFSVRTSRTERAEELIKKAIEEEPENSVLLYQLGTLYTQERDTDKAIKYLSKAIDLKPDYYDAIYNVGALYYTQGAAQARMSRRVSNPEERKAIEDGAKDLFNRALPYFEKAIKLKPKDQVTLHSLQAVYGVLGMQEQYNRVTEELKNAD